MTQEEIKEGNKLIAKPHLKETLDLPIVAVAIGLFVILYFALFALSSCSHTPRQPWQKSKVMSHKVNRK